jgi:hypothetical protein
MPRDGLSLFRTLSGGAAHRALVHGLRGDPASVVVVVWPALTSPRGASS